MELFMQKAVRTRKVVMVFVLIVALMVFNFSWYRPQHVRAGTATRTYLFWDPGSGFGASAPSGWTFETAADGYFPRGEDPGSVTSGTFPVLHTGISRPANVGGSTAVGVPSGPFADGGGGTGTIVTNVNSHPNPTVTVGNDVSPGDPSNPDIPVYRSLKLMYYTGGTVSPNVIPAGAIAMFGTLPAVTYVNGGGSTVPIFNAYTSNNSKMIKVDSSVTTGGSDTEKVRFTLSGIGQPSTLTTSGCNILCNTAASKPTHIHAVTTTLNCNTNCATSPCTFISSGVFNCEEASIPAYVEPILAQAQVDAPTLSVAIIGLFNGDPGAGWQVLSNTGNSFYHQLLRPQSTYNVTSQGVDTRPALTASGTSGAATDGAGTQNTTALVNNASARAGHTHLVSVTTGTVTNDNLPPYFDVVIAQKVSFQLEQYKWYIDPNSGTGTTTDFTLGSDEWPAGAGLNIGPNTGIPATPVAYQTAYSQDRTQLRLRVRILVSANALPANSLSFKLQYAKTTYNDCVSDATAWHDLKNNGASAPDNDWTYGSNAITDDTTLTTSYLTSTVKEVFSKSTTVFTNPNGAFVGDKAEYDWLIQDNAAADGTQYAFRPVQSDGTLLSYYGTTVNGSQFGNNLNSTCPIIVTKPGTDQQLRHGEFFQDGIDGGFSWAD
jgi:hypothetical protein